MSVWQKHLKSNWNAFDKYSVKIRVKDMVGGKPADPEIIEKWVEATNKEKSQEERDKIKEAQIETLGTIIDEQAEKQGCVFSRVDGQLCIEGRQVKAMLKESANIVRNIVPKGPIAAFKSKVADQVFVLETYVPLGRTKPDLSEERPIHVMTAQGPRTSIKRVEIVKDVELEFTLHRKKGQSTKSDVPEAALMAVLDYAQSIGLGADRSQGRGLFEVLSVEKVKQ